VPALVCDAPELAVAHGDVRDRVCASRLTAIGPPGNGVPGMSLIRGREAAAGSLELSVPAGAESSTSDTFVAAAGNGQATAQHFPAGSLVGNFPDSDTFDASLPIGILTLPAAQAAALRSAPSSPGPSFGALRRLLSARASSGLTYIGGSTICLQVSSNDDNSNTTGAAFYATCWDRYKPTNGDNSSTYNYRVVWSSSGSAHGGNFSHHLDTARNKINYGSNNNLIKWRPDDSTGYSDPITITVGLTLIGNGVSGSISSTFKIYPDRYGIQYIDLPSDQYWFGWQGDKGCGGGSCDYIGIRGGSEEQYLQSGSVSYTVAVYIHWHLL
jgi:hypothetical protein